MNKKPEALPEFNCDTVTKLINSCPTTKDTIWVRGGACTLCDAIVIEQQARERAIAQRLKDITMSAEGKNALTLRVELHNLIEELEKVK
jgi:hypothetical protein